MDIHTEVLKTYHEIFTFEDHVAPLAHKLVEGVRQRGLVFVETRAEAISVSKVQIILEFAAEEKDVWFNLTVKVHVDGTTDTLVELTFSDAKRVENYDFGGPGDAPLTPAMDAIEAYVRG